MRARRKGPVETGAGPARAGLGDERRPGRAGGPGRAPSRQGRALAWRSTKAREGQEGHPLQQNHILAEIEKRVEQRGRGAEEEETAEEGWDLAAIRRPGQAALPLRY